jgi:hypothetical protein
MTNSANLIKAFQVFKEGTTSNWITILIPKSEFNDSLLQFKIKFYSSLGYTIKTI